MTSENRLIDSHCHILPGIDDGAADSSVSLEMAVMAVADGIGTVIATPHIVEGLFEGRDLEKRIDILQTLIDSEGIDLRLLPGAELPMSICLQGDKETLAGLALAGGAYLLMETAETGFEQLKRAAYQVRLAGFYPVLAHPERTSFVSANPEKLIDLVAGSEVFCQLTAASLEGLLGKSVRKTAEKLISAGAVHLIATDAHSTGKRRPLLSQAFQILTDMVGNTVAETILLENPARLVKSAMLKNPPSGGINRSVNGLWKRLKRGGQRSC